MLSAKKYYQMTPKNIVISNLYVDKTGSSIEQHLQTGRTILRE